eukprot:gnl/TRDRNA2_/TRDRNA2_183191_c0_seq1.p1 gnl/TRDRNA2_/TRDRNA2_183191_c0~~gnl/TRDRNA2_/TRDRNA2_183191_c0_seq1.p1  ORF type:complete len:307 (+),score=48.19 gnl/TRDRNA2_/TRDRNA2_183191_c0_seq1:105-1025(+)
MVVATRSGICVALLAAFVAGDREESAFVQKVIKVKSHRAGSCDCIRWKQVYDLGLVSCGQGFELASGLSMEQSGDESMSKLSPAEVLRLDLRTSYWRHMGSEVCDSFYQKIDHNSCTRVTFNHISPAHWMSRSWCYVSASCAELNLNGGALVPGAQVGAKLCQRGSDDLFAEKHPQALYAFSMLYHLNAEMMMKFAYPTEMNMFFDEPVVRMLYENEVKNASEVPTELLDIDSWMSLIRIKKLLNASEPAVMDVARPKKSCKRGWLRCRSAADKMIFNGGKRWRLRGPDAAHYGQVKFGLECERGC